MTSGPKRLWYPVDLIDEVLPAGRDSPEAWLSLPAGFTAEDMEELDEDETFVLRNYKPGDTISFRWVEDRGEVTLRIRRDGTLFTPIRCPETPDMFGRPATTADETQVPPANHYWHGDLEIFAETAEAFAGHVADMPYLAWDDDGCMEVEVQTYCWSEDITYRIGDEGDLTLLSDLGRHP
ncbi:MAG: hypothetical protein QMD99_13685 [Rhizobiaceae bacterium]|nr:hypothetical protein [Rhizobiaceae bacterium]